MKKRMSVRKKIKPAFTLLESIIVLAIASMIFMGSSVAIKDLIQKNAVTSTSNNIMAFVQLARQNSVNSESDGTWGICQYSGRIYVFKDNCDSDGRKYSISIPNNVSVTGISTTTFSQLRGEPDPSDGLGNINVYSSKYRIIISVKRLGGITQNVQ